MYISEYCFTGTPDATGRTEREIAVYALLDRLNIPYFGLDHDRADTMEICEKIEERLGAHICKNLFLCNRQQTVFYLLLMPGKKIFKTKFLSEQINSSRLSFGSAQAMENLLGVTPGSATVFGLMFDKEKKVKLLIDKALLDNEYIGCHPCVNTSVLRLKTSDLINVLLPALGYTPAYVTLPDVLPEENRA